MSEPDHIHDCTGPDATCPCGYVFRVEPICVSIEITNGCEVLIQDCFNCSALGVAISALRQAAWKLEDLK